MVNVARVAALFPNSGSDMLEAKYLAVPRRLWQRMRSISPAGLSRDAGKRWSHGLARAGTVLLLVLLSAELADLTWALLLGPGDVPAGAARSQSSKTTARTGALAVDSVIQAHLFGRAGQTGQAIARRTGPVDAPETKLDLVLVGVYFAADVQQALAIIAPNRGDHQVYGVGDALPGGATVEEIHVDQVLLKRGGRLEVLKLVKDGQLLSDAKQSSEKTSAKPRTSRRVDYRSNRQLARTLERYQKQLRKDPMTLSNLARVQPVRDGDRLVGYKLSPGKDPRLLNRFGLRPGDVLVSVNGIELSGPEKIATVAEELSNAKDIDLEVLRGRAKLAFSFKVGL